MARNELLILVFFIFVSQLASFSVARKFPEEFPPVINGVIFSGEIPVGSKAVNGKPTTAVECEGEEYHFTEEYSSNSNSPGIYVAGNYGSLVLNVLPKGSVPASGPSKRVNDVNT